MFRFRSTQHCSFLDSKYVNATLASSKDDGFGNMLISIESYLLTHRSFSFSLEGVRWRRWCTTGDRG